MSEKESNQASLGASDASLPAKNGSRDMEHAPTPLGSEEHSERDAGVAARTRLQMRLQTAAGTDILEDSSPNHAKVAILPSALPLKARQQNKFCTALGLIFCVPSCFFFYARNSPPESAPDSMTPGTSLPTSGGASRHISCADMPLDQPRRQKPPVVPPAHSDPEIRRRFHFPLLSLRLSSLLSAIAQRCPSVCA